MLQPFAQKEIFTMTMAGKYVSDINGHKRKHFGGE